MNVEIPCSISNLLTNIFLITKNTLEKIKKSLKSLKIIKNFMILPFGSYSIPSLLFIAVMHTITDC